MNISAIQDEDYEVVVGTTKRTCQDLVITSKLTILDKMVNK